MVKKRLYQILIIMMPYCLFAQFGLEYTLEDKCAESTIICEGKIVKESVYVALNGDIYTEYTIDVSRLFKGLQNDKTIKFSSLGGVYGDVALKVCPSFHLGIGEAGIFFLRGTKDLEYIESNWMPVSADQSWIEYGLDKSAFENSRLLGSVENAVEMVEETLGKRSSFIKDLNNFFSKDGPEVISITNITPLTTQAGRGKEITVTGTGFGATRDTGVVLFRYVNFGSSSIIVAATEYNSWSDTEIKVLVPSQSANGSIKVKNNAGQLSSASSQTLNVTYNVTNVNLTYEPRLIDDEDDGNGGYTFLYSSNTAYNGVDFTSLPTAIQAVERAINTWTAGTKIAIYGEEECGTTSIQEPKNDDVNVLTFDNDLYDLDVKHGPSVVGVTFTRYIWCRGGEWEINDIDMVLRRDGDPNRKGGSVNWEYGPGAPSRSEIDFESVVLHELGHGNGLGHTRVSGSVMYPSISSGTTHRTLHSSETTGGSYIHGESIGYYPACRINGRHKDHDPNKLCSTVLPLDLVSFYALNNSDENLIKWVTVNEINHSFIILQYNNQGSWTNLAKFPSKGNDSGHIEEYSYIHKGLWPGIYTYRLKIVAFNGDVEYSDVASCEVEFVNQQIQMLHDDQQLVIKGYNANYSTQISVVDIQGRVLWDGQVKIQNSVFSKNIVTSNWRSGVYFIRIAQAEKMHKVLRFRKISNF